MLLHGDGTNGAQNNTFLDSSTNNFTITRNGNTTQGTFTPYGSNWSTSFNGSSDFITTPQTTSLNIGTGTFTVEAFVYLNSKYTSGGTSIINLGNGANGGGPYTGWGLIIDYDAGGSTAYPAWYRYDGSVTQYTSSTSLNVAQWYHLAVARDSSNNIAIWVNGTRVFSGTSTVTYNNVNSDPLNIGKRTNGSANSPNWMNGYISNGRVVIGSNVYDPTQTTITVPTTPLTAVTNTQLLVLQSNRFIDNSSAARTMTVAGGSPSVQRFSPFSPTTAYSTSVIGGSLYGDGTGDYLSIPYSSSNSLNAGDFTVEAWVYKNSNAAYMAVGGTMTSAGPYNTKWQLFSDSGGTKISWCSDAFLITSSATLYTGTWYHVAFVRSSGTLKLYINGVLDSSASDSRNYNSATDLWVAQVPENVSGRNWNGYITNFRINPTTAVYTANFTPNTTPLTATSGTSFLLATTNAGILDNAMMNDLETVGNAQISTSVKKYGTGSMSFDGSGDYLLAAPSENYQLGTGDFTIEFWINASASGSYNQVVGTYNVNHDSGAWRVGNRFNSLNQVYFARGTGSGVNEFTASVNVNDGSWHHVAVVRSSGTVTIYVDGTSSASASITGTCSSTNQLRVGYNPRDTAYVTGYIDDLRITKGVARYTANFSVPTAAFPNN